AGSGSEGDSPGWPPAALLACRSAVLSRGRGEGSNLSSPERRTMPVATHNFASLGVGACPGPASPHEFRNGHVFLFSGLCGISPSLCGNGLPLLSLASV